MRTPQVDQHQVAAIIRSTSVRRADPAAVLAEQAPGVAGRVTDAAPGDAA